MRVLLPDRTLSVSKLLSANIRLNGTHRAVDFLTVEVWKIEALHDCTVELDQVGAQCGGSITEGHTKYPGQKVRRSCYCRLLSIEFVAGKCLEEKPHRHYPVQSRRREWWMERADGREQSPRPGSGPLSPGPAKLSSGKSWGAPFRRKSDDLNHEKKVSMLVSP